MTTIIKSLIKSCIPPAVVRQKLGGRKRILFTFDDGPNIDITPQVLDLLDTNDAKGLFFIPGKLIEQSPPLVKEILRRGHGVGNHSWSHQDCSGLNFNQIVDEITTCQQELHNTIGIRPKFFRPPKGIINMSTLVAARRCGCEIMRWSFDTGEYSYMKGHSANALADNFLRNLHDRAIVLSHDDHPEIPKFLKIVLPQLIDQGYDLNSGLTTLPWYY